MAPSPAPSPGIGHNRPDPAPFLPGGSHPSPLVVPRARIYRLGDLDRRAGRRGERWRLEFEPAAPRFTEPLMGYTGSADPFAPIRMEFPDLSSAIAFAEDRGWDYDVREPVRTRRRRVQSYASRFRYEMADAITRVRSTDRTPDLRGADGLRRCGTEADEDPFEEAVPSGNDPVNERGSAPDTPAESLRRERAADAVTEALIETFPASDPPAFTGATLPKVLDEDGIDALRSDRQRPNAARGNVRHG